MEHAGFCSKIQLFEEKDTQIHSHIKILGYSRKDTVDTSFCQESRKS